MMTTEKHTYDYGTSRNSYFNGHDGLITRDDGKSIRLSIRDNLVAVNVKDRSFSVMKVLDTETQAKLKELNEHMPHERNDWGATGNYEEQLYERCKEQWWHDAEWMTAEDPERPDWTDGIYSDGRSSGWCVIEGTSELAEGFPTIEWTEQDEQRLAYLEKTYNDDAISADEWDTLRQEYETLIETKDLLKMRDEFLELAFNLVDNIEGVKKSWGAELIEEDFDELEANRQKNTILGDN